LKKDRQYSCHKKTKRTKTNSDLQNTTRTILWLCNTDLLITIHFPLFYGVSFLYQTRKMLYLVITSNLSCLSWFICSERQSIDFLTWIHPWVFVRSVLHNHRIVRVVFCRSLFVFVLFVFLWQLYCLSFFNICYLVTSLKLDVITRYSILRVWYKKLTP
jgi:hypothetical protein